MPFDVGGIVLSSPGTTLAVNGASNWMNVNASGILTRPQTPYFRGQLTGLGAPYNAGGAPLKVTADENVGNCWNNTTGLFTCPVAGYYLVLGGSIAAATTGYFYLRKNGSDVHFTHWNHSGNWTYVPLSAIILAAVNDYFSWHLTGLTPATTGFYGNGGHNMWAIGLLP